MTDKIEIQGKTVEAAVSEALLQLGARRDEVEIKVLEEPKSGFMGFLGGRAAKVLVRKKQSRRRGGSGRDHRVDDNDHKAHNLSGGGGRSRGRRGGSGRKQRDASAGQGGENKPQGDSRQAPGESRGGSRRGSRGRGGRGRSQGGAARNDNQNQRQGQGQDQRQAQGKKQDQRQAQDQNRSRPARPAQPVKSEKQEQPASRGARGRSRNERGRRGPDNRPDSRPEARPETRPETRPEPRDEKPRERTEAPRTRERPAARAETGRNRRREAPLPDPVETTTPPVAATQPEIKEVPSVSTPKKPRRAFGGLGARLKERRAAEKAAKEAAANPPATPAAAEARPSEPAAPAAAAPVRQDPPRMQARDYDNRSRGSSNSSYGSNSGDEAILEGIQAVTYAKPLGTVTDENLDESLTELTDGLLARAGFPGRCETHPGEYRQIKVTTDDASAGMLIGRHGQAIDAVEHLVERMASNAIDARARINLDINNYRQRQEEALVERVKEAAERISESGRPVHMEPMSARERRIVHLEALELGGVRTYTMDGSGGKHVVIAADEEATAPSDDSENVEQE